LAHRIEWTEAALARLEILFDFIARHSRRAATRAINELFRRVKILGHQPRLGAPFPGANDPSLRQVTFGNYRVIYRVANKVVRIIAVQHIREERLDPDELE
jgi:plasmid stabilization system protein ParE